jgi:hypothetical protein
VCVCVCYVGFCRVVSCFIVLYHIVFCCVLSRRVCFLLCCVMSCRVVLCFLLCSVLLYRVSSCCNAVNPYNYTVSERLTKGNWWNYTNMRNWSAGTNARSSATVHNNSHGLLGLNQALRRDCSWSMEQSAVLSMAGLFVGSSVCSLVSYWQPNPTSYKQINTQLLRRASKLC